jgi:adenosine deaminase
MIRLCSLFYSVVIILLATVAANAQALRQSTNENRASTKFDRARHHPPELRAFLEAMPKGADLHMHLTGAVYAESFVDAAARDGLCVDLETHALVRPGVSCSSRQVPAENALKNQNLYDSLIDAFSMKSFVPSSGISGHDQFFATFSRFQAIDGGPHLGEWVDEVASRAASQNEQYLEIMHTPNRALAVRLGREVGWSGNMAATRDALLAKGLRQNVETDKQELDRLEADRNRIENCASAKRAPACDVKVRYLFQVLRGFPPEQVFAQTLVGFELASVDPRVVGINLVMPEDWYLPMTEYHRQMEMFGYLHSVYPKVHISLHAGELAMGLVPPSGLRFHVREAIELGHAERIGHGVDIMYEDRPNQLLQEMATRRITVEINLTSNDVILGVSGNRHPLPVYRASKVPIVLSTDDEGVSRIDLTHEYQRAVEEFGLSYRDLKAIAANSLKSSFLPEGEKREQEELLARKYAAFEAAQ